MGQSPLVFGLSCARVCVCLASGVVSEGIHWVIVWNSRRLAAVQVAGRRDSRKHSALHSFRGEAGMLSEGSSERGQGRPPGPNF